ncbi:uncharacterized protein LOC121047295 [Ixodes scapularis]|uniref:uncharacterized protein LOC121047295 n=1 Tax=Ixodes scapularis TaxID=6945 RepID=UPI001AD74D93|nr:uncharacterized protein LOC121047295 [Ixodes scapularis]
MALSIATLTISFTLVLLTSASPVSRSCGPQPGKRDMMSMLTPAADMFIECYRNYDKYGIPSKYLTIVLPSLCENYDACASSVPKGTPERSNLIIDCLLEKVKSALSEVPDLPGEPELIADKLFGCSLKRPTVPVENKKSFFICVHWYHVAISID